PVFSQPSCAHRARHSVPTRRSSDLAYVDREFGTGVVKVTPAHDFNDYQVGVRHSLPLLNILTADAKVNDNAPAKYRGLDRYDARDRKSTRLNSSHVKISYAVFCLKK